MSLCEGCLSNSTCEKKALQFYQFPDGAKYEVCKPRHKSEKVSQ